jgi:alcohol dehydrogenase class IV
MHNNLLLGMLRRVCQPAEVCVGVDSLNRLQTLPPSRALVLANASSESNGALSKIREHLKKADIACQVWNKKSQEPTAEGIAELGLLATHFQPNWIVAIGGGSILDMAKFVWANYEHPDLLFKVGARLQVPPLRKKARLAAIPTTAGSGSEASQAAVLTDRETRRKQPFVSPEWMPDIVILDPTLTASLTAELTAGTGMDALTHAVEASVSRLSNVLVQSVAGAAVRLLLRWLPAAHHAPDNLEAREKMLTAAYLAGMCQSSASTGIAHSLAHAASAVLSIPHGLGVALFLPLTMRHHADRSPKLYAPLAQEAGFAEAEDLLKAIEQLAREIAVPRSLPAIIGSAPSEKTLDDMARIAMEDVCTRTNPVPATASDLRQLLEKAK